MRDAAIPVAMLFATLGLMLGFAPPSVAFRSAIIALIVAIAATFWPLSTMTGEPLILACWIAIIVLSLSVYWPRLQSPLLTQIVSAIAGLIGGIALANAAQVPGSYAAFFAIFTAVPASLAVARGYAIAPRVVMGWLLAVTMLGAILPFVVPHPGYVADHKG